jgi:hypothetical protein
MWDVQLGLAMVIAAKSGDFGRCDGSKVRPNTQPDRTDSGASESFRVAFTPQSAVIMHRRLKAHLKGKPPKASEKRPFRYVNIIQLDEPRTRLSIFRSLPRLSG